MGVWGFECRVQGSDVLGTFDLPLYFVLYCWQVRSRGSSPPWTCPSYLAARRQSVTRAALKMYSWYLRSLSVPSISERYVMKV